MENKGEEEEENGKDVDLQSSSSSASCSEDISLKTCRQPYQLKLKNAERKNSLHGSKDFGPNQIICRGEAERSRIQHSRKQRREYYVSSRY